ncbi:proteasome assembly chaperone family protein [Halanaeroarchaeum sulfurireducens]|uniref:3-isopropylmalate dehydratase n=1 Tax=Halanaeroarchaeum sulfurireducens TaxID=1604004 RepID=A0A0F7PD86_9EURY|nr:proteasome assembly chaperone family protein [Halanaeroarchaeum sulfurireducens]AKH97298.1 3-isopropylmalate dehydratase [Halanaeroarchaeum sulfurireducens]ALG81700.1 3-isopropylmalate dehydratase [Halanaeroarchaeum sulfurireducens]
MNEIEVEEVEAVELDYPVFIEGLPGVGHVGKLVAEHLVEEMESQLVRQVYSEHFPPQVVIDENGTGTLAHSKFYAIETEGRDLLVLTGNHQASDGAGHYRLTDVFLDIAESVGAEEVIALGGVPTGELIEDYSVLGAVSNEDRKTALENVGVEFREEEPEGGIVGTSGLLLGMGGRRGLDAACVMGETSGYVVDPMSARAVLEVLEDLLDIDVAYDALDDRAEEMEKVLGRLEEMDDGPSPGGEDDLRYIG